MTDAMKRERARRARERVTTEKRRMKELNELRERWDVEVERGIRLSKKCNRLGNLLQAISQTAAVGRQIWSET